jgi:hypothetical protein
LNIEWKIEEHNPQSAALEIGIVNKIRESIPKYSTRQMQKDFIMRGK